MSLLDDCEQQQLAKKHPDHNLQIWKIKAKLKKEPASFQGMYYTENNTYTTKIAPAAHHFLPDWDISLVKRTKIELSIQIAVRYCLDKVKDWIKSVRCTLSYDKR